MKFKILIGASIIISTSFCTNSDSGKKKNQNITKLLILNSVLTGSKPAIVFSATDGVGKSGIYTMGSDGSSLKRITNSTYGDSFPVWSPDGSKIVFVRLSSDSTSNIYLMNADGSGVVQVTKGTGYDSSPVWSPDGTKIAFQRKTSSSSSGSVIYTILTDGTSETSITGSTSTTAAGPKWSPDGSKLAYTSTTSTIALVTKKSDGTGSHSSVDTTSLYYPGYT
ncbi:MAG TPA: hypothetical protein PKV80_23555, partial [Leptospiraceae bacterium]|nr:hypothetical protein [Leptospiraceae bacterium]